MTRIDPRGRVAVVTGASSGIGEATARQLARAGMRVVAAARRVDRLEALAAAEPGIEVVPVDVTDAASVATLAATVRDRHGACHVLVNNAGIGGGALDGPDDLAGALRVVEVNLIGTMRVTAALAPLLAASAPAQVVNVASVAGKLGLGPAPYITSKFGMVGLSEALDVAWADRDVRVSQVNPGFITTEGFPQAWTAGTPVARLVGVPDDVARAVLATIVRRTRERTVPRWYRPFVVLRHAAPPVYRMLVTPLAGQRRRHEAERGARQGG